ncbi:PAS-domain containing protein [Oleiagrimonas citrea]|uniref:histidine kinase n=1 Tax=Oleiagrimonas citrea TaxID=1665687 RepID=A0A846ZMH6_9GAMM|nr:PAS-domain containing protein [Oleiagrimonas citrea]NKZ38760.1 response regulator [Oleiagrimonas citrea]
MHRRLKRILLASALLLAIAGSALVAGWLANRRALHALSEQQGAQLQLRALSLQRLIDRYRVLPSTLALDPALRNALEAPSASVDTAELNRKLERTNGATHVSTLTLIDRHGTAIAASNWRQPSSNVGHNYAFRPYFQRAMRDDHGTFYAIGVSTQVPGYFIAQALHDDAGRRIGVIVVKITLSEIRREWASSQDVILLSDRHGVVFLANRAAWQYRPLKPLDAATLQRIAQTRQYGNKLRPAARMHIEQRLPDGGRLVRFDMPTQKHDMLWRSRPLPAQGWELHSLARTTPVVSAVRHAVLLTLGGWLPVILFGMFLHQRLRLAQDRQRTREELERLVAHYASALRSEQDSLVQAALSAARGQPQQLEHLPQGVSVVDAQLRLVAWNRRYADIFAFPPRLLETGRPIEDLFRYNAQRGLLGPGDVEEAIQRRLDYLREGGPHMYERERPDGTVLEIRGNPLPGGGFVTSYADITPYKKAARALRTLTSTLELRVERSTRELRLAKAEAERANRNKTRYVAAAVHDLLQPLNAARLFSGALHKALHKPDDHAMLERVEHALQALDDQLGSMLDLSRLEAGVIRPKIEDIELAPLLQSLARQFGIIAQAKDLSLRLVNTRAWVRSDAILLRRILQNFLSNALHYTPRGSVLLGCRRRGENLRIEVWDTGVGIPEDKRQAIFQEFARLDTGLDTDERSAGLGLSIVERVAGLLGHPLSLRSWPEHGSVFAVTVPRVFPSRGSSSSPDASVETPSDSPLAGRHILCIDDDRENADALATLLGSWSCTVHVARSADALQDMSFPRVDLILLDYQLGKVRGPELLPALYARLNHRPPVIVLTAQTGAEVRRKIREAGLHFLAKPASPARLRALASQLLIASGAS